METERMIRELRNVSKKHENDTVYTFETNISVMCTSVANRMEELYNELQSYREKEADGLLVELDSATCGWNRDDDNWNIWQCSACGVKWNIIDGTPFENDMCRCPACGAKIETITERYFDYDKDDYVMETLTREEAKKAMESEG